jgi:DNA-directed RNA polymerase subunit RPC12/RpoP
MALQFLLKLMGLLFANYLCTFEHEQYAGHGHHNAKHCQECEYRIAFKERTLLMIDFEALRHRGLRPFNYENYPQANY